tara:strand:+ start:448 stop:789 length:342 start_codon:yes stop_codon:yes gene_type:complete
MFKLPGHTLPGINQRKSGKKADGRAASAPFQKATDRDDWQPAYEGADYSQAELDAMSDKQKKEKNIPVSNKKNTKNTKTKGNVKKEEVKVERNQWGETPEEYRKRMKEMGLQS